MQVVDANGNMFGYDSITVAGPDGRPKTLSSAIKLITLVRNTSGSTMTKGTVVYINGGSGNKPTIARALATSDATSAQTYGVVQSNIPNNKNGYVVVTGALDGVNTSAYAPGTQLYLSSTVAGEWTSVKQLAPNHLVYVGIVVRQHVNQGVVEIKIQNGYELDEIHDVSITTPLNDQVLQYESSTQLWKNKTLATGITIGSTSITSGTVGRVLFEGAGNVVQESANLSWDDTNGRVTVNTITNGAAAIFKNSTNGFTIYPQSTQVQVYSDYFGAGTDKPLILGTYANRANQLTLFTSGNIGVNTTTDVGFKADINGSTRVSGTLWTDNISPVGSTLYIYSVGANGVGGYNRLNISYNSTNGFVMQSDGGSGGSRSMSIFGGGPGGSLNLGTNGTSRWTLLSSYDALGPGHLVPVGSNTYDIGTPTNTVRYLYSNLGRFSGSLNAATNLAQGVSISNTLVATANNDVLVGLDVQPTFTNGAFTGVSNFAARFGSDVTFTARNSSISVQRPATQANGFSLTISAGGATTQGTGGSLFLLGGSGTGGPGSGQVVIGNDTSTYNNVILRGYTYVTSTGPNQGTAFAVFAGGQTGISIYWDNPAAFMQYGLVSNRQARFVNSSSYTFSSKVFINTNTDAGYNFDVNGPMRATTLRSDNPVIGFAPSTAGVLIGSNQAYRIICDGSTYYDFRTNAGIIYRLRDDGSTSFGSTTIDASAMVDIQSTTKGFLPPRMTTTQKNAIASPAAGLMVYDTTLNVISYYNGTMWV